MKCTCLTERRAKKAQRIATNSAPALPGLAVTRAMWRGSRFQPRARFGAQLGRRPPESGGMPDPIQSSTSTPSANSSYDPHSDDVGNLCRADAPNSSSAQSPAADLPSEPPPPSAPAVGKLISALPQQPSVLPPAAAGSSPSTADNNAQRTSERNLAPYANAGVTGSGDSLFAGVAVLKGSVPKSNGQVEAFTVSGQIGAQTEAQLGFQRVAGAHGALGGGVEIFTARANIGIHNDDGSTGFNVGAGATAVGFEGSYGGANSFSYGVAASVGASVSLGVRDVDRDGNSELCGRASIGPITVGICLENPL